MTAGEREAKHPVPAAWPGSAALAFTALGSTVFLVTAQPASQTAYLTVSVAALLAG